MPQIGSALTITLGRGDSKVRIAYHTTEKSAALQWLAAEQTRDRKHPFLFTQGEAIFTRTWIPLQDSPDVRVTYEATIRAPKALTAVMSAEQLGRGPDGAWRFRMPRPSRPTSSPWPRATWPSSRSRRAAGSGPSRRW